MSAIISSFRINLDLFEFANFGTNYGLQTVHKTRCSKVVLHYSVPLAANRFLEVIDTLGIFFCQLSDEWFRNDSSLKLVAIFSSHPVHVLTKLGYFSNFNPL